MKVGINRTTLRLKKEGKKRKEKRKKRWSSYDMICSAEIIFNRKLKS